MSSTVSPTVLLIMSAAITAAKLAKTRTMAAEPIGDVSSGKSVRSSILARGSPRAVAAPSPSGRTEGEDDPAPPWRKQQSAQPRRASMRLWSTT